MTSGTTMGNMSMLMSNDLPRNFARVNPIAAIVPSVVANKVANGVMIKLLCKARCQIGEVKNSWYQRNENPDIGYIKKLSELNDSGIMDSMGSIRNSKIKILMMRNK